MSGRCDWPVGLAGDLEVEVAALDHAGHLGDVLELVSPHEPRTCGLRSAVTSDAVSLRSASPVSRTDRTWARRSVVIATRSFSTSVSRAWNCSRLAATGARICSVAWSRCAATVSTCLPWRSATSVDSSRNWSTIACRSAAISWARARAVSRCAMAPVTSASVLCGAGAGLGRLRAGLGRLGAGVGELLAGPRQLTLVPARGERTAQPGAGAETDNQREEHEQGGDRHGGIVTQTTDRTPDHTPDMAPSPTLRVWPSSSPAVP